MYVFIFPSLTFLFITFIDSFEQTQKYCYLNRSQKIVVSNRRLQWTGRLYDLVVMEMC